jgi:hypothetical protein
MAKLDVRQKNFPMRADYGFFPSAVQAYFVKNFTSNLNTLMHCAFGGHFNAS